MLRNKSSRYEKKKPNTSPGALIGIILLAAVITGLFFGFRALFPGTEPIAFNASFPGSNRTDLTYGKQKSAKDLKDGLQKRLIQTTGVLEYYQIAGKTGTPPSEKSEFFLFEDQVDLLSFYVEQKDKSSFNRLNDWVKSKFQTGEGFFVKRIDTATLERPKGTLEVRVSDQIRYCRVLIEAYDRFRQNRDLDLVKSLSTRLYPLCKENNLPPPEMSIALPEETPTPDFTATPEPKPSVLPTIDPAKITYIGVVDLATIDLYALQLLSLVDGGWKAVYDHCLDIVQNAAIDDPVPLYQAGYDIQKAGYVPYLTQNAEFVFEDQMKIMLHLAEVSQLRESSFSYLKQQLFNTKSFYQTYQILTGTPSTENESITGYAIMARIARIRQDKELYELCIGRIAWNTATIASSEIFGLPFRTLEDGTIRSYAKDVISALKANY